MTGRDTGPGTARGAEPGTEHVPVVVVGGGQAGLSMSWHLTQRRIDHVVLERDTIAHEWSDARWDAFCLVTPNWQCRLPGFPYDGEDPDGFMVRDEIVAYLRRYVASFDPPVREHVEVSAVRPSPFGGFDVATSAENFAADAVVVATGGYHTPSVPRFAERLPASVAQVHSVDYRHPDQLPEGEVLVVGTGQSGAQIAEDLHVTGRRVHLCVGSAPRVARFYRGRDCVSWLDEMGHYRLAVGDHPLGDDVRHRTNHYVTGRDGGRDIDLRAFAKEGMRLYGSLTGVTPSGTSCGAATGPAAPASGGTTNGTRNGTAGDAGGRTPSGTLPGTRAGTSRGALLTFAPDLKTNLDGADAVSEGIKDAIDTYIAACGIPAPVEDRYRPVWKPPAKPVTSLELGRTGITSVVWCTGFRPDYRWLRAGVFDGRGEPVHERGVTAVDGLYFLGLPWQHTWGSGRFSGVGDDAAHLATNVSTRLRRLSRTPVMLTEWGAAVGPLAG